MVRARIDRYKVRQLMKGRYDKLEDLAAAARISPTTVSTGTDSYSWRSSTLDAIANALGCSPLDILTVDEVNVLHSPKRTDQAAQAERVLQYDQDFTAMRSGNYTNLDSLLAGVNANSSQ
jgi:DNA-binding Xre family transcriptional regulator